MYFTIRFKRTHRKILLLVLIAAVSSAAVLYYRLRYPLKYMDIISKHSETYNLDPAFVYAVINAESSFRHEAVSPKGASGLMQITPVTADWIAREMGIPDYSYERIFEPELNITIGTYYLNKLSKQYGDNRELTLAAYNAGSGNVAKWLKNPEYSLDGQTLSYVPFSETRNYIVRINRYYKTYSFILKYLK